MCPINLADLSISVSAQETYDAVTDTANINTVAAALTQLQTKNYRCIILYLSLASAINVMNVMYARGMYGAKYFVVLSPILRTPQLFQTGARFGSSGALAGFRGFFMSVRHALTRLTEREAICHFCSFVHFLFYFLLFIPCAHPSSSAPPLSFAEGSFYVANGGLMIEPVTAVPAFMAQLFTKAYAARKFAANGDDAGVLGQFAFGAL